MTATDAYPPEVDYFDLEHPTLRTEFIFSIRVAFASRLRFLPTTPMGGRGWVPTGGGVIEGPRLQGRVVEMSGADWARGRPDRVTELNAHYLLEAADGTPIYIHNRGFVYGYDRESPPQPGFPIQNPHYFRIAPSFDCPVGPHDWLTRTTIIGIGKRFADPDHSKFLYFAVL